MSLKEDLIRINDALSATLHGVNDLLPFEAESLKETPPIIEEAIRLARQEGKDSGYTMGYDDGHGVAESFIVCQSNEAIEKYTAPAEDWSALPSKIDEVHGVGVHDGKISLLESSKYMRGSAEGELVTLRDVSPVRHNVGVEVSRKNWANLSTPQHKSLSDIVSQTESTITLITTASGRKWNGVYYLLSDELIGKTLTISATWKPSNDSVQNAVRVQWVGKNNSVIGGMLGYINASGQTRTFSVAEKPADATYLGLILYAVADSTTAVAGDTVTFSNVQLEVGTTATPYAPYIEDTSDVKVRVRGKNWFGSPLTHGGLAGANGGTYASRARLVTDFLAVEPGMTYIFSGIGDLVLASRHAYDKNKKWIKMFGAVVPNTVTVPDGAAYIRVHFTKPDNTQEFSDDEVKEANELPIQLELGTAATDYVPYTYTECDIGEPIPSVSPIMTVTTDTEGVTVSVEYLRDIDLYIDSLVGAATVSVSDEQEEEE